MPFYLVRSGANGEFEQLFLDKGGIYFDWPKVVIDTSSPENLFHYILSLYTGTGDASDDSAGEEKHEHQAIQFAERMKSGDWIVMPSKHNPTLHFGKIKSDYQFHSEDEDRFQHCRIVEWFATDIPRDRFPPDILDLIGNFHTIYQIQSNNAEARIKEMAQNNWHIPKHSPAITHDSTAVASLNEDLAFDSTQKARDVFFRFMLANIKSEGNGDLTRVILEASRDNYRIFHKDHGEGEVIKVDRTPPYSITVKFDSGFTETYVPVQEVKKFKSLEEGIRWKERIQKENELKDRLREFNRLLSRALAQPLVEKVRITPPPPDADDRELVSRWLKGQDHPEKESEKLRLTSARLAEKAATQFFESYGKSVTDVAITQTTGETDDWIQFDLDVEGNPIDVKNARRSERNENRYVDHCVPEFKEAKRQNAQEKRQSSQEVQVAGVLSYWQNLSEMENPELGRKPALILGVTHLSEIETIKELFSTSPLQLDLRRGSDGPTFLPPWIYNYPDYCYKSRDQALKEIKAFNVVQGDLESPEPINLLPILIASDHPQIQEFTSDLNSRESKFLDRLLKRLRSTGIPLPIISLPILFLTVLEEFLMILREGGDQQFEKGRYARLLFPSGSQKWPLYIYDPLQTVHTLLETLDTLWEARVGDLNQMTSFRLHNLNVLSGRGEKNRSWQTILAYCGGRISGKYGSLKPCGQTPLVMRECENCPACGKLICSNPECKFCSDNCRLLVPRHTTRGKISA